MKRTLLVVLGIIIIVVIIIGYQVNSALNTLVDTFHSEHKLSDPSLVVLTDSISPNGKFRYFKYNFDNGAYGYSRVFWSIMENQNDIDEIEKGLLPDGYMAIGWTENSELIVQKWEPYYYKENEVELNTGDLINKTKIILIK